MKKYVIINATEVGSVDFSQVSETSVDTLRYNLDGSKTFLKFEGEPPAFLVGKTQFDHADMLDILKDPDGEWYTEITI